MSKDSTKDKEGKIIQINEEQIKDHLGKMARGTVINLNKNVYATIKKWHNRPIKGSYPIRRRTRVVGNFPNGESALMLVAARLRHIASTKWSTKQYLNMRRLKEMNAEKATA